MDKESKEIKEKSIETDPFVELIRTAQAWKIEILAKQAKGLVDNRDTIANIRIDPDTSSHNGKLYTKPKNILGARGLYISVELRTKNSGIVTYQKGINALLSSDETNPDVFYNGQWNSFLKLFNGWLATAQDSSILIIQK